MKKPVSTRLKEVAICAALFTAAAGVWKVKESRDKERTVAPHRETPTLVDNIREAVAFFKNDPKPPAP